jgi:hypothetical protein
MYFARKLRKQFENDEKIAQLSEASRRRKQLELRREIQRLMQERKEKAERDKLLDQQEDEKLKELEKLRLEVVEQERQRLLREHASGLADYLPKV